MIGIGLLQTFNAFDGGVRVMSRVLRQQFVRQQPTVGRQGNDVGTQYRSGIYAFDEEQLRAARASLEMFQQALQGSGYGTITTEIIDAPPFYYAEDYHQQYLAKNPGGYCGLGGTGVSCPAPLAQD